MKIKKLLVLFLFMGTGLVSLAQGKMFVVVEAQKQGKFKAELGEFGAKNADKTELAGFAFEVTSPRDAASGQASGKRRYEPVTIWKKTAESSPQFMQALVSNEVITKVTIEFHKTDALLGIMGLAYSVVLENARISSFRQSFGTLNNEKLETPSKTLMYDEIMIVFEKITVTDAKSKMSANDSWMDNR